MRERCRSFLVVGIEGKGNGTIIDQVDFHCGAKLTSGHRLFEVVFQATNEVFIERDGRFGPRSMNEAGARAFFVFRVQGELAHHQGFSLDIHDGEVHLSIIIGKDAECSDLSREPFGVALGVVGVHTQQNHEAMPACANHVTVNANFSPADPLHHCPHDAKLARVSLPSLGGA